MPVKHSAQTVLTVPLPLWHVEVVDVHDELLSGRRSEDALPPLFHLGVHHVLRHVRGRLGGEGDCERRHRGIDAPDTAHRNTNHQNKNGTNLKMQGVKDEHEEELCRLENKTWSHVYPTRGMMEKTMQGARRIHGIAWLSVIYWEPP